MSLTDLQRPLWRLPTVTVAPLLPRVLLPLAVLACSESPAVTHNNNAGMVDSGAADASIAADAGPDADSVIDASMSSTGHDAATNLSAVFVHQADVPMGSNGCAVHSAPSGEAPMTRTLDLAFSQRYATAFLIGFVAPGPTGSFTRIVLQETEVTLEDEGGQLVAGPSLQTTPGIVEAVAGGATGYGIVQATLVHPDYAATLVHPLQADGTTRHFTASIHVLGQSLEGDAFTTAAFSVPVDVCFGCLVTYPIDANNPDASLQPNCNIGASLSTVQPCVMGQDEPVDCRLCNEVAADSGVCQPPM